eukprot:1493790-Prymnesium_polylepis.1
MSPNAKATVRTVSGRLNNKDLVRALEEQKTEFTSEEWKKLKVKDLRVDSFVELKDASGIVSAYYEPSYLFQGPQVLTSFAMHYYEILAYNTPAYKQKSGMSDQPLQQPRSEASGLKWQSVGHEKPSDGKKLENKELAASLQKRIESDQPLEFDAAEWCRFGVDHLEPEHFIKLGNTYFKPSTVIRNHRESADLKNMCLVMFWFGLHNDQLLPALRELMPLAMSLYLSKNGSEDAFKSRQELVSMLTSGSRKRIDRTITSHLQDDDEMLAKKYFWSPAILAFFGSDMVSSRYSALTKPHGGSKAYYGLLKLCLKIDELTVEGEQSLLRAALEEKRRKALDAWSDSSAAGMSNIDDMDIFGGKESSESVVGDVSRRLSEME